MKILAPAGATAVSGMITLSGTASDNQSVQTVLYAVDSGPFRAATGKDDWSVTIDTTAYPTGSPTITVRAVDAAQNQKDVSIPLSVVNGLAPVTVPGTVWGIFSSERASTPPGRLISYLELVMGRKFTGRRIYGNMMEVGIPGDTDVSTAAAGGITYHSINSFHYVYGQKVCYPWSDVAAGVYDAWWTAQADAIKAWGKPILLTFTHEPEVNNPAFAAAAKDPSFV